VSVCFGGCGKFSAIFFNRVFELPSPLVTSCYETPKNAIKKSIKKMKKKERVSAFLSTAADVFIVSFLLCFSTPLVTNCYETPKKRDKKTDKT
jgi:hypothetical protein